MVYLPRTILLPASLSPAWLKRPVVHGVETLQQFAASRMVSSRPVSVRPPVKGIHSVPVFRAHVEAAESGGNALSCPAVMGLFVIVRWNCLLIVKHSSPIANRVFLPILRRLFRPDSNTLEPINPLLKAR